MVYAQTCTYSLTARLKVSLEISKTKSTLSVVYLSCWNCPKFETKRLSYFIASSGNAFSNSLATETCVKIATWNMIILLITLVSASVVLMMLRFNVYHRVHPILAHWLIVGFNLMNSHFFDMLTTTLFSFICTFLSTFIPQTCFTTLICTIFINSHTTGICGVTTTEH